MNEMIEKVAKAILEADGGHGWHLHAEFYRKAARFAIEAMREPTEAMQKAGYIVTVDDEVEVWQTMIDEALK